MSSSSSVSSFVLDAFHEAGLAKEGVTFTKSGYDCVRSSDGQSYFVKTGSNAAQMIGESESLKAMSKAAPGLAPNVYLCKEIQPGKVLMISDYFDFSGRGAGDTSSKLAKRLASEMHNPKLQNSRSPNSKYGFHVVTHCGNTGQNNEWENDWMVFYRDRRIKDLVDRIGDPDLSRLGNEVCDRVIPRLLTNFEPKPEPVILHGDLWAGNFSTNGETGGPAIFDPSSYYGHNEAELGIMRMFGGFGSKFFEVYHSILPKSHPHYEERQVLYELYHHLNHTLLFGGVYKNGSVRLMQKLINWEKTQHD